MTVFIQPDLRVKFRIIEMVQWRNIDTVIENRLFLGNINAARSTRTLAERGVTHILSICTEEIYAEAPQSGICHMRIPVEDVDYEDILIHLPSACRFIDQALRGGGVVLVHCIQGISRSATVVAAYMMWSRRIGVTDALHHLRTARDQIWPNPGFHEQLLLFEVCGYQPSPANGHYAAWRYQLDRRLRAEGLR